MRARTQERTSQHVDPHELSSQFLLSVWPEDRAAALACLDQPPFLRQVRTRVCEGELAQTVAFAVSAVALRCVAWTWLPSRAAAADHRTHCAVTKANNDHRFSGNERAASFSAYRGCLHLRRAHKERHPVFPPRTWTNTLLATQRRRCNAADRKTAGKRVATDLHRWTRIKPVRQSDLCLSV